MDTWVDAETVKTLCQTLGPLAGAAIGAWATRWNSVRGDSDRARKAANDVLLELYVQWLIGADAVVNRDHSFKLDQFAAVTQRLLLMDADRQTYILRQDLVAAMPERGEKFEPRGKHAPFETARQELESRLRERFAVK